MRLGQFKSVLTEKVIKYGNGDHEEGQLKEWSGIVYHGTESYDFFEHLKRDYKHRSGAYRKLNKGKYFSTSPELEYTIFFSDAYIVEFAFSGNVYYPPLEDTQKKIFNIPDEADAYSFPLDKKTHLFEIELSIFPKSINKLKLTGVHCNVNGKRERKFYPLTENPAGNEWDAFLRQFSKDVFGDEVDELVDKYSGTDSRQIETQNGSGAYWIGDITFDPNNHSGPKIRTRDEWRETASTAAEMLEKLSKYKK